ncbi:MAG: DNA-processing protein DprA [candidate division WOR-3 bacterium]|jgi:DNA processing protein
MNEKFELFGLVSIQKITQKHLYTLLERFGSPQNIMSASVKDLRPIVGSEVTQNIASFSIDNVLRRKWKLLQQLSIQLIPYYAADYPAWLKQIDSFPPVIFVRGKILLEDEISIAVIGTRGASVYGKEIARRFAGEFAQAGVTVVSGLARGVDTEAHRGALQNSGRTIAVLGCGIDTCYPPENKELMHKIIKQGAVVSEFNINTPPFAGNFPKRNRIVSGLAKAVVAIEAKEKSGVMNTVRWALEQNKDVFAIPGNILSKTSFGTNKLIKDGAIPVTSADDVLEYLGLRHTLQERETEEFLIDESERAVWEAISFEPICLDALSEKINQSTSAILNVLLRLEIKGYVKQLPGMTFVRSFETPD